MTTPRLDYIDGLRAIAALWVVFHHAIQTSAPTAMLNVPVLGSLLASFFWGQAPVKVFLLLSGFCLYYPCVRKNPANPVLPGITAYLRRRWTRIAPPYLWAIAFCLPLAAFPALHGGKWVDVTSVEPSVIVSHLFMVHNLISSHSAKINYPLWSIGLEWQLYLVFPVLVVAFRRWGGVVIIGTALVIAGIIWAAARHVPPALGHALTSGPFYYLELFTIGMWAAALAAHGRLLVSKWLLGVIAVGCLAFVRVGSGNGLLHDVAVAAAAFAVLQLALDPAGPVARLLSARWLVSLGLFSYSLYLVHAPLLHLSWLVVSRFGLSNDMTFVVLCLVCVPAIIAASYAFHCAFERPYMHLPAAAAVGASGHAGIA